MVGWHHQLNGHESEQTSGDSEGQESLVCCSPWSCKDQGTTEHLKSSSSSEVHRSTVTCRGCTHVRHGTDLHDETSEGTCFLESSQFEDSRAGDLTVNKPKLQKASFASACKLKVV